MKCVVFGGEGYVMNYLDKGVVKCYFVNFDKVFKENKINFLYIFFNDFYEVYGVDWIFDFLE